jgi:MFS family permease
VSAIDQEGSAIVSAVGVASEPTGAEPAAPADRFVLAVVAISAGIGSLGLAAGGTAGALLAGELTGSPALIGVPLGVLVAGSAVAAILIGRRSSRSGRASGLMLGYLIGICGAVVVLVAAVARDFTILVAGSFLLGAANPAVHLTRYAGADAAGPTMRGRGLGVVFLGNTIGAVLGPNLLGPAASLATIAGVPGLAGLYLIAIPAFALAALLLVALAPRARAGAHGARWHSTGAGEVRGRGQLLTALRIPGARDAVIVLMVANLVMVAIMAVLPVHLVGHGHDLSLVGAVVSIHVLGMFAPSPLTGWLTDRWGGGAVAAIGGVVLVAAGVAFAVLDQSSASTMAFAMFLLGLGWNAGVVGGSALLTAAVPVSVRPQVEGVGEVGMGLAAAGGAPIAGVAVAVGGLTALSLAGGALGASLLLLGPRRREAAVRVPD